MSFLDKYKIKDEEEEEFSFLNKYKTTTAIAEPEKPTSLIEGLPMSKPEDKYTQFGIKAKAVGGAELPEKPGPTWGEVIKHSLKAGLGQYQASLVNLLRTLEEGRVKVGETIFPFTKDTKYQRFLLDALTKVVEDSEKIATENREQAESKSKLKEFVRIGVESVPQIAGSVAIGVGMPVPTGIAAAKPLAEITTRATQMIPFGLGAMGGQMRQIEKEYEELGKEAPYWKMVIGGALSGAGEMATELPVFIGVARLFKTGGKELIEQGAKTLVKKYGKLGVEYIKNIVLQASQEAWMVPIEKGIKQAIGLPEDWDIKPLLAEMGENAYAGLSMAVILGVLGGSVAGTKVAAGKTVEIIDNAILNKTDIRETLRKVAEAQGVIPEMPEAVALGKEDPTISGLSKPDEDILKKIDQGQEYDLKEEGVNLSNIGRILKKNTNKIIDAKVRSLEKDIEEKEVGLFGKKKTTQWIEDYKTAFRKEPTKKDLKEIATEQLTEGYEDIGGKVAPDPKFKRMHEALYKIEQEKKPEDRTLDLFAKPEEKVKPTKVELEAIEKPTPKEVVEEITEKIEPEPTPEEIREVFMKEENLETTPKNRELFYEKYNKVYADTKRGYDRLIDEKVADLKEEGFKGVDRGGLKRTEEGEVVGAYPTISRNPKWYRDFYAREKKAPTNRDLKEIAKEQLLKGHTEDYGEVPASEVFVKLEAQLDSYEAILSDIKEGDYSFETPKNIDKLNDKLKELAKKNRQIATDYAKEKGKLAEELEVLKAEKAEKFGELYKEVEAKGKVEVKVGIKKGVKEAITGKKLKGLSEEEIKIGNRLMGQINKIAYDRGLTQKRLTEIKQKYGFSPHLATATKRMTIPQLEAVLKGVQRARPKIIRHMKVITPKTEGKIQSLKDNLIDKYQMTEEVYQEVLKDLGVYKEPKYIDGKHFITEQKGKEIIYRLIDEANILKVVNPFLRAVAENKEASANVDKINKRLKAIVDRGLRDPHELTSMRLYFQTMETITGAPFFPLYQDLINAHLENKQKIGRRIKELQPYDDIIKDEKELKKVNDYILSKSNLEGRPETPKNITEKEIRLAEKIEGILKDYEARARTEKFLDNIDHPEDMPQYLEFKKEIDKAKDIYESKGYDDLVEYMKDQKWGVIRNAYSPLQVLTPKVRIYRPEPQTFGKGPIKVRTDIEYHEQDRNIIQRLLTYEKQMNNLVVMRPKIKALITLIDKNVGKFKDPDKIAKNMGIFFRELKGYNKPENWFDRGLNRLYAQAMQTIILPSPVLSFRNLLQNIAFGHDKSILIDPRNKSMTKEELAYFDTYISQLESMNIDWFMTGERPLPGMALLTKMVKKISIYPYSDLANRHWGYWAKMNEVKRVFAGDKSLDQKMKAAKFGDMELIEQKMALQILAKDGQEAMAQYVSRVYVNNTQFLYDRSQRSLAEMGRFGRVAGNLMLFPRAYWEMLYKQSRKMGGKNVNVRERIRAFKVLSNIIIGGILVGAAFKKVTGRKENPYDPLRLLAYEPGGLALGTVEAVTDLYVNIIDASKGLDKALATASTTIPHAADMFLPFYAYIIRALEASTDTKNIDRKAIRKLRMIINKEYQIRGGAYIVERNAMEKWQYFLAGAGVDVTIKERKAEKKKPRSPYLDKYKGETTVPSTYLQKYKR